MPREGGDRDWHYAATSQGMSTIVGNHQKIRKGKETVLPYSLQRRMVPPTR